MNKAIINSRLRPQSETGDVYLLIFIAEQNLAAVV